MFRLLQVVVSCMIVPMVCLGFMAGLSGGGLNPAFQRIGQTMIVVSPIVGIVAIVASFILHRMEQTQLAYVSLAIPIVVWIGLLIWLQLETQFFTW